MKHVIVFAYIFTILIGVSALTIQWLAGKGGKLKKSSVMRPFIIMLLFMNVYDFFIFYSSSIIEKGDINILLSIGDCFIAMLVLLWLRVINTLETDTVKESRSIKAADRYVLLYAAVWLAAMIFFREIHWIRLIIDLPLIVLLLGGSVCNIQHSIETGVPGLEVTYKVVITFFMCINYASYFISESGLLSNMDTPIMDITIFYWLVINIANTVLLYKRDFKPSFIDVPAPKPAVLRELPDVLESLRIQYDLTKREVEILGEVYSGKTNTQIAETLYISESTVKAHIYNLFRKLGVKSRVEAVCIVREEKEQK